MVDDGVLNAYDSFVRNDDFIFGASCSQDKRQKTETRNTQDRRQKAEESRLITTLTQ